MQKLDDFNDARRAHLRLAEQSKRYNLFKSFCDSRHLNEEEFFNYVMCAMLITNQKEQSNYTNGLVWFETLQWEQRLEIEKHFKFERSFFFEYCKMYDIDEISFLKYSKPLLIEQGRSDENVFKKFFNFTEFQRNEIRLQFQEFCRTEGGKFSSPLSVKKNNNYVSFVLLKIKY